MKRKISLILLLCMAIYMGGYHLIFAVYQQNLKQEMKAYIRSHEDASIGNILVFELNRGIVSDENFVWEEQGKEFRYRGEYYDVISMKREANALRIVCLKDGQENQLDTQLQALRKQTHQKTGSPIASVLKFFSCFNGHQASDIIGVDPVLPKLYTAYHQTNLADPFSKIALPPPRA